MRNWKPHLTTAVAGFILAICLPAVRAAESDIAENLGDRNITIAVETELLLDEAVPAHAIDVATEDGIVTLSGSVDSYYAKLEAEDNAESTKGVLEVINNIVVKPPVRLDSQIRGDIVAALAADPVTESYEVVVNVDDGIVTLTGDVDSYSEKTVAEEVAEGIEGVKLVKNQLTYDLVTDRTDPDIKSDIEYRLRSDATIKSGLIQVTVDEGDVTLDGKVSSAAEKNEAETEAWSVFGVKSVENDLDVEWWAGTGTSDWTVGWTDEDMRQAIETALTTNPRVESFNVTTTVDDGVATLTGTVDNLLAKRAAEEEAQDVLGIWRVKNFLRVRSAYSRTDSEVAADIRNALRRSPYVNRYDVLVSVYNGRAYLTGEVDSWFVKSEAEEAAATVPGVIDIQNSMTIDYDYTAKSDKEIKEDIESQLWWSPFVDSDDITVMVNAGTATLTGTVEDWDELEAAKENARQGGATSVVSKLKIANGVGAG